MAQDVSSRDQSKVPNGYKTRHRSSDDSILLRRAAMDDGPPHTKESVAAPDSVHSGNCLVPRRTNIRAELLAPMDAARSSRFVALLRREMMHRGSHWARCAASEWMGAPCCAVR